MANYDNPGFCLVLNSRRVRPYTASGTIAVGDIVAQASGSVLPFVSGTHDAPRGIAATAATTGQTVYVHDQPDLEFVMQTSGSYVAATYDGVLVGVEGTTGIMEINEDATTSKIVKVLRHLPMSGAEDTGANARVRCRFSVHAEGVVEPDAPRDAAVFTSVSTDTVSEKTAGAGVTIDGVKCKDGGIICADAATLEVDTINEATATAGVTADGVLLKDGQVTTSAVLEATSGGGVSIAGHALFVAGNGVDTTTATGAVTLTTSSAHFQRVDPGGAGRDLTLPADQEGLWFLIFNAADNAEDLTIKDAGAVTICVLNQNQAAFLACDGATWVPFGLSAVVDLSA